MGGLAMVAILLLFLWKESNYDKSELSVTLLFPWTERNWDKSEQLVTHVLWMDKAISIIRWLGVLRYKYQAGRYRDINTRSGVPVLVVAGVEPPKADKGKGYPVQCGGNRLLGSKIQWLAKALGIFLIIAVLVLIPVQLLILQLQFLDDEGDQAELWALSRVFVDTLIEETTCEDRHNIYSLAKELISHLDAEDPKKIFGGVEGNSKEGPSFFSQAASFFFSLNRFMKRWINYGGSRTKSAPPTEIFALNGLKKEFIA
ncbi:hypothetical protein LguiA_026259 [Lonicera macranthoides]